MRCDTGRGQRAVPLGPVVVGIGGDVLHAAHVARGLVRLEGRLRVVAERIPLAEAVVLHTHAITPMSRTQAEWCATINRSLVTARAVAWLD